MIKNLKKQNSSLKIILLTIISFFLIIYIFEAVRTIDPDFGWHIRTGQIILSSGIPKTDPFSYTMPSYHFVDHEWLSNILLALSYPLFGIKGLAIISSILIITAILIPLVVLKPKERIWFVIPLLITGVSLLAYTAIRVQILSWLYFSILITIILSDKFWVKFRYLVPFLVLLWVNTHGSFPIAIIALLIHLSTEYIEKKKIRLSDIIVFLVSIFLTIANPYGIFLWQAVWIQGADLSIRLNINEWRPAFLIFQLIPWFSISITSFFVIRNWKDYSYKEKLFYVFFIFFGISANRNLPYFLILSLVLIPHGIYLLFQEASNVPYATKRLVLATRLFLLLIIFVSITQIIVDYKQSSDILYPKDATIFLENNKTNGQILNYYDWGGYLDWKLPEKKVFIDGRMPSWKIENPPKTESADAFIEYKNFIQGKIPLTYLVNKYHITTILLPISQELTTQSSNYSTDNHPKSIISQLKEMRWKRIYTDKIAVIYQK